MATCVSNESNPFTPAHSFTLKPRAENCADDYFSALTTPLLGPSFGRGLRIRSSFDEDDSLKARMVEPRAAALSVTVEPPLWAVRASGEARLEVSSPVVVDSCVV